MYYNLNNYPSAVTEERLAGIVCGAVKDYLSEQSEHVRHCHETIEEQQVAELKECLNAIYTGKVSSVTNHYNGCEVTQHYLSEQTQIVNPTFGAIYDVHGNGKVSCGN